ncbi:hypothetical protein [Staphylococcus pettenkoferi]|uniref:hypothetical protein n=1 Tax=Staphylococcus pettenkoferi TaxID=170573 RepID=UPI001F587E24|nr:hypothetical protein [Staphylococcus pettenkoferi]MCI2802802.1 hypothetical protein [Staphylococcus pettenkoferi]
MTNFEIKSVNTFQRKYRGYNDSDVIKNMNREELKSFLIMNYNLLYAIEETKNKYDDLSDENELAKDEAINELEDEYEYYVNNYSIDNKHKYKNNILHEYNIKRDKINKSINKIKFPVKLIISIVVFLIVFKLLLNIFTMWLFFIPLIVGYFGGRYAYKGTDYLLNSIRNNMLDKAKPDNDILEEAETRDLNTVYSPEEIREDLNIDEQEEIILNEFEIIDEDINILYWEEYEPLQNALEKLQFYLPMEFHDLDEVAKLWKLLNDGYGDNWKEIINIYREQKNFEGLQSGLEEINSKLENINNNIVHNHYETMEAMNYQNKLMLEVNKHMETSNRNLRQLNKDMNTAYEQIEEQNNHMIQQNDIIVQQNYESHRNQQFINEEVSDLNPRNPYRKYK